MKKQLRLFKTLLVAALLSAGAGSAWAQKEYSTMYSETFDEGSSSGVWTMNVTPSYTNTNPQNSTKYCHFYHAGNSLSEQTLSFATNESFANATDYIFSFYYNRGTNNYASRSSSYVRLYDSNNNLLFAITATDGDANKNTDVVTNGSGTELLTGMTTNGYKKDAAFDNMYLVTVKANKDDNKITLTIANGATTTLAETTISNTFATLGSLKLGVSGRAGCLGIDDIIFQTYSETETVTAPSFSITGVNGSERTITVTNGISSKSSSVSTYYTTNGDVPTSSSTVYSAPFTVNTDCTIKLISISSTGGESSVYSEAVSTEPVVLNAPQINMAAKNTFSISSDQSDKLLKPTATINVTVNGEPASLTDGKINNLSAGDVIVAYASASGYSNSTNTEYTVVEEIEGTLITTYDFSSSALTSAYGGTTITFDNTESHLARYSSINYYQLYCGDGSAQVAIPNFIISNNGQLAYGGNDGLYNNGGGYRGFGILNAIAGQKIVFEVTDGTEVAEIRVINNATGVWQETYPGNWTFTVNGNGTVAFDTHRYSTIKTIKVFAPNVAGTISSSGYTTLASAYGLNFAGIEGLTAYVVSKSTNDAVTLTSVDELPAGEGVILKGSANTAYSIPVKADATFAGTNLLEGILAATILEDGTFYILKGGEFCLVEDAADEAARTVPAGKAYLPKSNVPSGASALSFLFADDESTGIAAVKGDSKDGVFYNLSGQRVNTPKKGLYIVNGVKVIIK